MKKAIGYLLVCLLVFGCAAVGGSAEEAWTPADNLVTHWDFDGETQEEALSDKAASGTSDKVVLDGTKTGAAAKNGILTIPNGALVYAANSPDLSDLGSKTIFLKVRMTGEIATGMPSLLYHAASYRICGGGYNAASAESGGPYEMMARVNGSARNIGQSLVKGTRHDVWLYMAFTFAFDFEAKSCVCTTNVSLDGSFAGDTFFSNTLTKSDLSDAVLDGIRKGVEDTVNVGIGSMLNGDTVGLTFAFDDIRFYDAVLTAGQMAQVAQDIDNKLPQLVGVQETAVSAEGTYSVRFIAGIDSTAYARAGFRITAEWGDQEKSYAHDCGAVYAKLTASDEQGSVVEVTAESLGAGHLLALSLDGIPANAGRITFTVTPYAVDLNGAWHNGAPCVVIYENGDFISNTQA